MNDLYLYLKTNRLLSYKQRLYAQQSAAKSTSEVREAQLIQAVQQSAYLQKEALDAQERSRVSSQNAYAELRETIDRLTTAVETIASSITKTPT